MTEAGYWVTDPSSEISGKPAQLSATASAGKRTRGPAPAQLQPSSHTRHGTLLTPRRVAVPWAHSRSATWLERQAAPQSCSVLSAASARGRGAMRTGSSARRATTPAVLGVVAAARALVASPAWVQLQARQGRPRRPAS